MKQDKPGRREERPAPRTRKKRAVQAKAQKDGGGGTLLLRASLIGAGCALGAGIVLLLILCAVCFSLQDPTRTMHLFALGALLPSALLCGVVTAHKNGSRGILSGLCGGVLFCVMLCALSLCLPDPEIPAPVSRSLITAGGCLLMSVVGGYAVSHKKPKSRRPERR